VLNRDGVELALPTVTGFAARQAIAELHRHSVATAPLLRRAGLSELDLAARGGSPIDHRVSAEAQAKFLDYAAEAVDDSAFGLHLAEQTDPRDAGILFYVASGAKNFGEALTLFERYFRIVNEAVRLKLTRTGEGLAAEVEFVGLPRHVLRQNAEFGISVILMSALYLAAQAHSFAGHSDKATAYANRALRQSPFDLLVHEAYVALGNAALTETRYEEAATFYAMAVQSNPKSGT
jgi:tetratricopeptide (TPR) repeat protein